MSEKIAIIGGTGFENTLLVNDYQEFEINTKFGKPSSTIKKTIINNVEVLLLSRHGYKHEITPSQVNNRANIQALKELGATHIFATSAAGSLREEIKIGDLVIVDQFIDFTKHRKNTFHDNFENGMQHVSMAEPFDETIRQVFATVCNQLKISYHSSGTVITIEGPRFSTRAESRMFRNFGADVINMSTAPECILANEAGIPYACIIISTDYDSWREDIHPVKFEEVLKIFAQNIEKVKSVLLKSIELI